MTAVTSVKDQVQSNSALKRTPSEQFLEFINLYIDGLPPKEAWIKAGYSETTARSARSKIRENWKIVDKMIDDRIGTHIPEAIGVVVEMMRNSTSETIRLKAAQDLLSRAGKDKPITFLNTTQEAEELHDEQLDQEIEAILQKLGMREHE